MFFWHKRSTITLDCFTFLETIALNHPIAKSGKFYPKDLKDVPKFVTTKVSNDPHSKLTENIETIKHCCGLHELYSNGIVIPAWDNFSIEMINEKRHVIHSTTNTIKSEHHPRFQYNNEIFKGYSHLKFISPWLIQEKSGVKFVWTDPTWNRSNSLKDMSILPAIINFKKQHASHINTFIKNGSTIKANLGDPLVHLIPMSEKKIKINIHVLSIDEWERKVKEIEYYVKLKNHQDLITPDFFKSKKKCPFGF
jgi:hypothetical protein